MTEMREESASEFEDWSIVMIQSEEWRGKDWSKINSGPGIHMIGIPEGEESETGAERICRVDGSNLPNMVKNTNVSIFVYLRVKRNHTCRQLKSWKLKVRGKNGKQPELKTCYILLENGKNNHRCLIRNSIFKVLKEKKIYRPRILCQAKIFLKNEGE